MTQQQTEQKIQLIHAASMLTAISMPPGSPETAISTQHERWYQFLAKTALPDESVYTSPTVPAPASPIVPSDPHQLETLAKALAPILATIIPGPAGSIASAVAAVAANAPLPAIQSQPVPPK